jgi:hypothetical protein
VHPPSPPCHGRGEMAAKSEPPVRFPRGCQHLCSNLSRSARAGGPHGPAAARSSPPVPRAGLLLWLAGN